MRVNGAVGGGDEGEQQREHYLCGSSWSYNIRLVRVVKLIQNTYVCLDTAT
eukprot:SAG31_NODE_3522_length_4162_cov_14.600541_2_plen_51_part_00